MTPDQILKRQQEDQENFEYHMGACCGEKLDAFRKYPADYHIKTMAGNYCNHFVYAGWNAYSCGLRDERIKHREELGNANVLLKQAMDILQHGQPDSKSHQLFEAIYSHLGYPQETE